MGSLFGALFYLASTAIIIMLLVAIIAFGVYFGLKMYYNENKKG